MTIGYLGLTSAEANAYLLAPSLKGLSEAGVLASTVSHWLIRSYSLTGPAAEHRRRLSSGLRNNPYTFSHYPLPRSIDGSYKRLITSVAIHG